MDAVVSLKAGYEVSLESILSGWSQCDDDHEVLVHDRHPASQIVLAELAIPALKLVGIRILQGCFDPIDSLRPGRRENIFSAISSSALIECMTKLSGRKVNPNTVKGLNIASTVYSFIVLAILRDAVVMD